MKIYRALRRYNLGILPREFADAERKIKKFRKYGIGYLHTCLCCATARSPVKSFKKVTLESIINASKR
jgi:hypothetical protein